MSVTGHTCAVCQVIEPKLGGQKIPAPYTVHTTEVLRKRPELADLNHVGVFLAQGVVECA